MKIIATIGREGFILQADTYEIGRIMGAYSGSEFKLEIGTEIPVSELYQSTRDIVAMNKELSGDAEKVIKLLKALQKFNATVGPIAQNVLDKELKK